jgi:hypothetical protein
MMSGDPVSYLEQCIAALPPEKREAARHAFEEISETGDDTYLSKLLAVLEANGAYAKMIPKGMTDAGVKVVRNMEDIASRLVEAEVRREASFKNTVTTETARLVGSLPVRQIAAGIERQNELLEQLKRATAKLEEGVSSGVAVFLVVLAFACGAGLPVWFFWGSYQEAQQAKGFCDQFTNAGLSMQIEKTGTGQKFTLTGPAMRNGGWRKNASGGVYGAEMEFDDPK